MSAPTVVVVAHAADRTGPPVWLLDVLRRLPGEPLDLRLLFLKGGELEPAFAELGQVQVIGEPLDPSVTDEAWQASHAEELTARRASLADLVNASLVVVNTAWSAHALDWLPGGQPVVTVVHELDDGLGRALPPPVLERVLASDQLVVGCAPVRRLLEERYGTPADRIVDAPYGIADPGTPVAPVPRSTMGATDDELLVVGAGVAVNRKGPDLFAHLAGRAVARRPDLPWRFHWIGARLEDLATVHRALADVITLGLHGRVTFGPPVADLRAHLAAADSLALTSREDAFPLVALEAGAAGVPVTAFDTTGTADLILAAEGAPVRYPDLDAMADVLAGWADPVARREAGEALQKVVRRDHDAQHTADRFRAVLDRWLTST